MPPAAPDATYRARRQRAAALVAICVLAAIVALLFGIAGSRTAQYTIVALLGGGVGIGELVSRYRDRPWRALRAWPAVGYVLLNAGAAAGALGLIYAFDWTFGVKPEAVVVTRL